MTFVQDFFLKYYDYRPFKSVFLNKIIGNSSKILGKIAQVVLPFWFKVFPGLPIYETQKQKVGICPAIVCLTSFPTRIHVVWLVIECLLRQQLPPSIIVLYLSKLQFPKLDIVNDSFSKYVKAGVLQIKWVEEDIKSHKKYWYAIKDFPHKDIILVDDDLMYMSDTIKILYEGASQEKKVVSCLFCGKIVWNERGEILPWSQWVSKGQRLRPQKGVVSNEPFFGSGGGTYFPYGSLADADQPIEFLQTICPLADDIWLNAIIRKNGYQILPVKTQMGLSGWYIKKNQMLKTENGEKNKNDQQLFQVQKAMMDLFNINPFEHKSV